MGHCIHLETVFTPGEGVNLLSVHNIHVSLLQTFCFRIWTSSDVCVTILSNLEMHTRCQFLGIRWDYEIDAYHDTANALNRFPYISGYVKILLKCHYLFQVLLLIKMDCHCSENALNLATLMQNSLWQFLQKSNKHGECAEHAKIKWSDLIQKAY